MHDPAELKYPSLQVTHKPYAFGTRQLSFSKQAFESLVRRKGSKHLAQIIFWLMSVPINWQFWIK